MIAINFQKLLKETIVKKLLFILFLPFAFIMAVNSTVFALPLELGKNITTLDLSYSSENSWYGEQEDQEVEPGMEGKQKWDLEGFFLNGNILTLVGGYNFEKGYEGIESGDLFFDTDILNKKNNNNKNKNKNKSNKTNVYDYVFDLDEIDGNYTYNIYKLDKNSELIPSSVRANSESDPWRYDSKKSTNPKKIGDTLTFDYRSNLTDADVDGMKGGTHYAMSFDLSSFAGLFDSKPFDFNLHYTMGCGNDNILGSGTIPIPNPEPFCYWALVLLALEPFSGNNSKRDRVNHPLKCRERQPSLPLFYGLVKGITISK